MKQSRAHQSTASPVASTIAFAAGSYTARDAAESNSRRIAVDPVAGTG